MERPLSSPFGRREPRAVADEGATPSGTTTTKPRVARRALGAVLATALATTCLAVGAGTGSAAEDSSAATVNYWNGVNPVTELTADSFANPPANDKPWVRWNFPPATTSIAQLEQDLDDLADKGIAGVEIGQGGNPTNEQLQAILTKANDLDITVGIKYSGGAPTTGTWVNTNDYTRMTLNNSRTVVDAGATFSGALPGTGTIVAAVAYRCSTGQCATTGARSLDRSSAVNLTAQITDKNTSGYFGGSTAGNLSWTAPASPAGAQWIIVTFRAAAFQNAPETLSKQGTQAMIDGYEALWTPEIKALLKENRSDIFVDSHPTDPWGNATELWSSNLAADFQKQAGYSITPDLAALFYSDFTYSDGRDERVRSDFYQVRNDLFIENRIKPFTAWANTHGMTLRLQPEDPNIGGADVPYQDQIDMAYHLQRPEHESLVGDQIDVWRAIASANSWTGNPWFSEECCAVGSQNYVETLQDVEVRMNKSFAAGITKNVYHVYPTVSSPTSTYPGYSNFGPTSFSGAWGPRNPNWDKDGLEVNTWMARNQQVLTQGRSDMDVAVYLHSFEWPVGSLVNTDGTPWNNRHWEDQAMQRAGYTWDYVNPTLLNSADAKVEGGELNADGPSYKALVINTDLKPTRHPSKGAMPVATAKRMLELAEDGLPIVLVGDLPSTTPGDKGSDAQLRKVIADLVAQPSVHRVSSEAGVPSKLASLGLQPDAKPSERSTLFSRHLKDKASKTDYYYLYNQGREVLDWASRDTVYEEPEACRYTGTTVSPCRQTGKPIDIDVTLKGEGTPYLLDTNSGEITPITSYERGDGTVTINVALGVDQAKIVALSETSDRFGIATEKKHVVSTTADSASVVDGTVVLRDTEAGAYTATLSDGSTVKATVPASPAAVDLTGGTWSLLAETWENANAFGATGVEGAAQKKTEVPLTLDGLKSWPDIPELARASGVGTYSKTVTLPDSWVKGSSAVLSLGQVVDTFTLKVNGTKVPINQLSATADIGAHLEKGENTIEVRVSTTLNNQLTQIIAGVATRGVIQEYGITGPVTLTPSGQAVVDLTTKPVPPKPPVVAPPAKVKSSVSFKLSSGSVKAGQRGRATVVVKAKGVSAPTGTLQIKKGSKIVKTVTLRAKDKGRRTFSLPKLAKGKHTLKVVYSGDKKAKGKTSVKRTLRVN